MCCLGATRSKVVYAFSLSVAVCGTEPDAGFDCLSLFLVVVCTGT